MNESHNNNKNSVHHCLQIYDLTDTFKDVRFHPHTSKSGVITGSCCVCSLLNFSHGPCYVTLITLKRLQHHCGAEASLGERPCITLHSFITHLLTSSNCIYMYTFGKSSPF